MCPAIPFRVAATCNNAYLSENCAGDGPPARKPAGCFPCPAVCLHPSFRPGRSAPRLSAAGAGCIWHRQMGAVGMGPGVRVCSVLGASGNKLCNAACRHSDGAFRRREAHRRRAACCQHRRRSFAAAAGAWARCCGGGACSCSVAGTQGGTGECCCRGRRRRR